MKSYMMIVLVAVGCGGTVGTEPSDVVEGATSKSTSASSSTGSGDYQCPPDDACVRWYLNQAGDDCWGEYANSGAGCGDDRVCDGNGTCAEVTTCEADYQGEAVIACQNIESNSHAITCAPEATFPPGGVFDSGMPGVLCYCNPGECPGVSDCKTNQDCMAWSGMLTKCESGLCVK